VRTDRHRHTDGRRDRQTGMTWLVVAFCNFSNAPKSICVLCDYPAFEIFVEIVAVYRHTGAGNDLCAVQSSPALVTIDFMIVIERVAIHFACLFDTNYVAAVQPTCHKNYPRFIKPSESHHVHKNPQLYPDAIQSNLQSTSSHSCF
jgi:hypothetical protein